MMRVLVPALPKELWQSHIKGEMRESCMRPAASGSTPEFKLSLSGGRPVVKKLFWWPDCPDGEQSCRLVCVSKEH